MTGSQVLAYEELREKLLEKARKVATTKHPDRYASGNHSPLFVKKGIYIPTHDGLYMQGNVLVTWEELGIK